MIDNIDAKEMQTKKECTCLQLNEHYYANNSTKRRVYRFVYKVQNVERLKRWLKF